MRTVLVCLAAGLCLCTSPAAAQQTPPATACFQVIEGSADVPPAAPLLVDRCTGETFVLTRARRGEGKAFEWVPIAKAAAGAVAEAAPAPPPRPPASAKAASKEGCFTYSGRNYCP